MKKLSFLLALAGLVFTFSCSKSGSKKQVLTDPQIDAKIGVVRGHVQYVLGYDISPDGKTAATVNSYDYIFWKTPKGDQIKAVRPEKYDRNLFRYVSAKYTPDGKLVVLGAYEGVKILNAQTLDEVKTLPFPGFNGEAFDISKDGKYLVVAANKEFKVIDLGSFETVKTFGQTENNYTDVAFLDNTQFVALEYSSPDMYLWDVEQGMDIMPFTVSESSEVLAVSPDGKYVAVYDDDQRNVMLLNSETSEEKYINTGYLNSMAFMGEKLVILNNSEAKVFDLNSGEQDGSYNISGSAIKYDAADNLIYYVNKNLIAINPEDGSVAGEFGAEAQASYGALPAPTGKFLVIETGHKAYSGGYNLLSLPYDTTAPVKIFGTASTGAGMAAFVGQSDNLATIVTNGDLRVYDLNTGNIVKKADDVVNEPLVFTPDGQKLIGKDYNQTYTYALFNYENMQKITDLTRSSSYVQYAGTTPDGRYYVLSTNSEVFVYDLQEGKQVQSGSDLSDTRWVDKMNDNYIAVRAETFDLSIVNLLTGETVVAFDDVAASQVTISPDKKYMAIAPRDHFAIYLYDFTAGDWKPVLYGHNYFPTGVAFTPDSKYLISTSKDNQTIIWDVATGKRVLTVVVYDLSPGRNNMATADYIVYAPNGRYDGTPRAIERFLYFEKDGKRLPASQYKAQCYTPDLLGRTLR